MEFKYNESSEFYAASLYKVPIAAAVLKEIEKGNLSLDDTATYLPYDYAAGSGVIGGYAHGIELKIREILTELLKNSDNTAQNILLRTLSYKNVEESFNYLVPDKNVSTFYRFNLSNPMEIGKIYEKLNAIRANNFDETLRLLTSSILSVTCFNLIISLVYLINIYHLLFIYLLFLSSSEISFLTAL